jgi:protein SCO1/2
LKKAFILFFILLFPSVLYIVLTTGKHNFIHLPYYGPKEAVETIVDGKKSTDTIYHTIPPFRFTNQDGKLISEQTFNNKIYVANFFFATCKSICPKMNSQMLRVQERFKDQPDLAFLSHTVNPERDTVEALAAYAKMIHADTKNWYFVTGERKAIYDIAANGYLVAAAEDINAEGGFLHSELLVLIDRGKRIRGFYDGTSVVEVDKLIDDIKMLYAEYEKHNKERDKITVGNQ